MMMNKMTWLIRHGESAGNAGLPTATPGSNPLTPLGHQQSLALVAEFPRAPDLMVVSPYQRTRQTAEPVIARFPEVPVVEWPVQEFTYLAPERYAGTTEAARAEPAGKYWKVCDPLSIDGEGAESFAAFIGRVDAMLQRAKEHPAAWIVIFTHGYVMKAVRWRQMHPAEPVNHKFMAGFLEFHQRTVVANTERIELTHR